MDRPHSNQHLTASDRPPHRSIAGSILIGGIRIYQAIGSPIFGKHCRFEPTCSHYGVEAIDFEGLAELLDELHVLILNLRTSVIGRRSTFSLRDNLAPPATTIDEAGGGARSPRR